MGIKIAAKWTS